MSFENMFNAASTHSITEDEKQAWANFAENMFNAASTHSITEDEKQAWANFALVGSKPNVFKNSTDNP